MTVASLILRAPGTNCDRETRLALEAAGAKVERLHVNQLLARPALLDDVGLLVLPGGFTFGDDVASGAVFAHALAERLEPELDAFVASGRLVLGVCNGFQILVRLGLLPGGGARAAMAENLSGRFVDRWVWLRAGTRPGPWLEPGRTYLMPVAHAEGRFEWFPAVAGAPVPEAQIALRYIDPSAREPGARAAYPHNPNGAFGDIAALTNPEGNVLGLMPHPERFRAPVHHPSWTRHRRPDGTPPREEDLPVPLGLDLYRRAVAHLAR